MENGEVEKRRDGCRYPQPDATIDRDRLTGRVRRIEADTSRVEEIENYGLGRHADTDRDRHRDRE